ncbi:MAG: hypothetical protein DMF26_01755 [Verrucomicrobia bacterium]|nr:MAG: hypothetical protein DMF26_01755 [Verrucomicrobiota bacterium]
MLDCDSAVELDHYRNVRAAAERTPGAQRTHCCWSLGRDDDIPGGAWDAVGKDRHQSRAGMKATYRDRDKASVDQRRKKLGGRKTTSLPSMLRSCTIE